MSRKRTQRQKKFYVCHKDTNDVWFTCGSWEEAREWIEIVPVKAQVPSYKFYVRKYKQNSKPRRFNYHDTNSTNRMENSEREKHNREIRDRLFD